MWRPFLALALMLAGCALAGWIQTDGGSVAVSDVRWRTSSGQWMSALLFVPRGVDAEHRAPGVLAVHGYINSRETQDAFAIELARDGYVVLAIDQSGHGYSSPPAFARGFGGPDGIDYLRSLSFVDRDNIGLLGHSMGGWAVLSAASARPTSYRSLVLVGSAPGMFGTAPGTSAFPHNLALVFGRWDEFSQLMWEVERGQDIVRSSKLKRVFGIDEGFDSEVMPGATYGDVAQGDARQLYLTKTTHAGEHFASESVRAAEDWFARTLHGAPSNKSSYVWAFKESATLVALLGFVWWLTAFPSMMLNVVPFRSLLQTPRAASAGFRSLVLLAAVPALTYFRAFGLAPSLMPASRYFPQEITNGLLLWMTANGVVLVAALLFRHLRAGTTGVLWESRSLPRALMSLSLALLTVGGALLVCIVAQDLSNTDFRFWVVAVKPPAPWHWPMVATYGFAFCAYFVLSSIASARLIDAQQSWWRALATVWAANAGGFVVLLLVQYGWLLSDHALPFGEPLLTIVAIQFVVILSITSIVFTSLYRRVGTVWLPAFVNGLAVSWIVVAGTATQA